MFPCARKQCRDRCLPADDVFDIKDYPDHFNVHYILQCGHTLCEHCLYITVQDGERSYQCDQCGESSYLSARAFASIKFSNLSTSKQFNRLNEKCAHEIPLDAYSLGLAFNEGRITASPVELTVDLEALNKPTMEEIFKYSKDIRDEENAVLKTLIPKAKRSIIPLMSVMHHALSTHAECGHSLKILGTMEQKLSKEFYLAKMRLREKFHLLHSLLQLEELKGITLFENNYRKRKDEYAQVEKSLCALRRQINEALRLGHDNLEALVKKRNKLKEAVAKPSRISWMNFEGKDEFVFEIDQYLENAIKNCLSLDTSERDTTISLQYVGPESSGKNEALPLLKSPSASSPRTPDDGASPDKLSSIKPDDSYRDLISGSESHVVKLAKIHNPELFWCTIWSEPEKITEMRNHIEKWCTNTFTHPPLPGTLKIGKHIFVFSNDLGAWSRAKLLSINSDSEPPNSRKAKLATKSLVTSAYHQYISRTVDVELYDYGGVERIPYQRVRAPFDEVFNFKRYPPLGIKCCLFGVKPRGDEWTNLSIQAFRDYCGNRQMLMMVRSTVGDLKKVDLYQHEKIAAHNNASLREVLVYAQHARIMLNEADVIRYSTPYDLQYIQPDPISVAKTEEVIVTEIHSPDLFYVSIWKLQPAFHDLHEKLKVYFELPEEAYSLYMPEKNLPCVALHNKTWYRALIKKDLGDDKVEVEFVDFGFTGTVPNKDLRVIREEFLKKPIFAIPCKLGDIGPVGGFKWSSESVAKFKDLVYNESCIKSYSLHLTVIQYESNEKHVVDLRHYVGGESISVNCALVSSDFAVSTGPLTAAAAGETVAKFDDKIFRHLKDFDVYGYQILYDLVVRNREAKSSKVDSFIKIRVTHWTDPGNLYIQIIHSGVSSYFIYYERVIADEYIDRLDDPVPPVQDKLNIEEPVIFAIREPCSTSWKRGIISKRNHSDDESTGLEKDTPETMYTIFARDYGYQMEIPRKHIWKLPSDSPYLKDGNYCIKCHLSDIAPAGGGPWTKSAIEIFNECLKRYQRDLFLYIQEKYLPRAAPESLGIDIIGEEKYIASASAPVKILHHSFKTLLITRGVAIPTRNVSLSDLEDDPEQDPHEQHARSLIPSPKKDSVLSYIRSNARRQMGPAPIQFYKDPERPVEENFVGIPTEVNTGLKIWFRHHRIDGFQILNIINRTIDRALKDQDELLPFTGEPLNGRACTAFFEYDNTWNRAEILYAKDIEHYYVRFVDYGNEVCVKKEHISSQVFHPEIPKLALYGYLANCKPAINEKDDDSLRLTIGKLIVDDQCLFTWENFQSLKDLKVSIVTSTGENLKDYLLSQNLVYEEISPNESVPTVMKNIIERITMAGYKLPTIEFKKNVYYPIRITSNFRQSSIFFHVQTIDDPRDETELAINERIKDYLASLETLRSEVETFDSCKEYYLNDFVVAMFSDFQWYRGIVQEVIKTTFGNEYRVLFVDIGISVVVEKDKMKKLPYRFVQNTEIFAFPAQVVNVKPKDGAYNPLLCDRMGREASKHEKDTLALIESTVPYNIQVFIADPENKRAPKSNMWKVLIDSHDLIEIKPVNPEIIEDTN